MSTTKYVVGVLPPTERITKMKAVYDSCKKLGIDPPDDLEELFNGYDSGYIEGLGRTVDIPEQEGYHDSRCWTIVKLSDIPDGIKAIAFIESY